MDVATPAAPSPRVLNLRRLLAATLLLALIAYGAALGWLLINETGIVFRAGRPLGAARPSFDFEQVEVPRPDGLRQFAWIMRAPAADDGAWVLYLHGNAATIASRVNIARYGQLRAFGLNVLAPEYRGFAGLDGTPSEASAALDARAAYEYLRTGLSVPPERIIIYGWSLGSAIGVTLAGGVPQAAVILEGAPASLADLGQARYPLFPVRLIMRNPFHSISRIARVRAPILFLHSPEDDVVPIGEGRRLYEAALAPKTFVELRGGHVYANEVDGGVYNAAIESFLAKLGLLAANLVQR